MKERENKAPWILFLLEIILTAFIPLILLWSTIPTNILNASSLFGLLEYVGLTGVILVFFAGIPMGVMGIKRAKEFGRCRKAMVVLSLVNLLAGILEVGLLILIIVRVILGGVSA